MPALTPFKRFLTWTVTTKLSSPYIDCPFCISCFIFQGAEFSQKACKVFPHNEPSSIHPPSHAPIFENFWYSEIGRARCSRTMNFTLESAVDTSVSQ